MSTDLAPQSVDPVFFPLHQDFIHDQMFLLQPGNPPPSLVWKLAGEPVNHSAAIPIREESLGTWA
ncbi:hypothetical protein F7725_018189 [Dissostichus mawsoni]|uniref:Uncharacterized protein n=1 Tax=Dissostichus mawsoni TaxID=36200 RepID=A0A7J5XQY0_DISMA|nr:hypothetical protein F7725_018189 [Dissostichus mawsoni]